jgi:hypothetical protein
MKSCPLTVEQAVYAAKNGCLIKDCDVPCSLNPCNNPFSSLEKLCNKSISQVKVSKRCTTGDVYAEVGGKR